jgi:WD40 repeat protein
VILWDLANGAKLPLDFPKWYGESDMFFCRIAYAPDDKTMAIVTDEFVGLWNIKTGKNIAKYDAPNTECAFSSVFFADNGEVFAAGRDAKSVMIWRITTMAH